MTILNAGEAFIEECPENISVPIPTTGECAAGAKIRFTYLSNVMANYEFIDYIPADISSASNMVAFITFNTTLDESMVRE